MRWATAAQPGSCIMLCPMSGKNSALVLYAFAVARTSALVTMPSSAAPRTSIGALTRVVLTRRNSGSTSDARTASGWTRAAHDSTMSSGVWALNRCSRTSGVVPMKPVRLPTGSDRMETHGWRLQIRVARPSTPCGGTDATRTAAGASWFSRYRCTTKPPRMAAKAVGRGTDIVDVVGDRTGVEWLGGGAAAVAAQAQRHRAVTGIGEEVHEVGPARRGMPTAVHEQQWHRMRIVAGSLVDHL